jgi:hypothetical protein
MDILVFYGGEGKPLCFHLSFPLTEDGPVRCSFKAASRHDFEYSLILFMNSVWKQAGASPSSV